MAQKPLNVEKNAELKSSPYVTSVISGRITFTPEFQRTSFELPSKSSCMRGIFNMHLITPEILADARI
jgi:hypothetical protein